MGKLLKKEERNNQFKNILSSDDRLDEQILTNVDELEPFSNHPFKLYEGERLEDMKKVLMSLEY